MCGLVMCCMSGAACGSGMTADCMAQMEIAEVLCAVVKRQDGLLAEMGDLREQVAQLLRKQERAAWL